jgi:hypothetical protein
MLSTNLENDVQTSAPAVDHALDESLNYEDGMSKPRIQVTHGGCHMQLFQE